MTTKNTINTEAAPVARRPIIQGPLAALLEWQAMAEGAYSPNTLRAQKADGAIFQDYCEARGAAYLPADPMTIREFIEDRQREGKKPATIKRYVATTAALGRISPCLLRKSRPVRLHNRAHDVRSWVSGTCR